LVNKTSNQPFRIVSLDEIHQQKFIFFRISWWLLFYTYTAGWEQCTGWSNLSLWKENWLWNSGIWSMLGKL